MGTPYAATLLAYATAIPGAQRPCLFAPSRRRRGSSAQFSVSCQAVSRGSQRGTFCW